MNFLKKLDNRSLAFFTFHKCGSQWVRDVINAPEVSQHTKLTFDSREINLSIHPWPVQKPRTLLGPIYNCGYTDWVRNRRKGQKALVVVRDPRDRLVSWVYSALYSHGEDIHLKSLRDKLSNHTDKEKIKLAHIVGLLDFSYISKKYASWFGINEEKDVYVTTYEKLLSNSYGEFSKILSELSFGVPESSLRNSVDRLSFERKSGRKKGEEDIHSHYRSGVTGDWKSKFSKEECDLWKVLYQDVLEAGGWESDEKWGVSTSEINH